MRMDDEKRKHFSSLVMLTCCDFSFIEREFLVLRYAMKHEKNVKLMIRVWLTGKWFNYRRVDYGRKILFTFFLLKVFHRGKLFSGQLRNFLQHEHDKKIVLMIKWWWWKTCWNFFFILWFRALNPFSIRLCNKSNKFN
jgi:hypothetical protein